MFNVYVFNKHGLKKYYLIQGKYSYPLYITANQMSLPIIKLDVDFKLAAKPIKLIFYILLNQMVEYKFGIILPDMCKYTLTTLTKQYWALNVWLFQLMLTKVFHIKDFYLQS